jgi:hypothetical protein
MFYAAKYLKVIQLANAQVTAVPFYLQLDISKPADGGTMVVFRRMAVARRSDGTTASIETVGPLSGGQTARKITFLDGRSLSLMDAFRVKSTWPTRTSQEIAALKAALTASPKDCIPPGSRGITLLGFEQMSGVDVAVIQSPVGGYRLTRWVAPRLGCEALRYRSERLLQDGSAVVQAAANPVSFVLGEPDARLFDLSGNYEEALPSTILSRSLAQAGVEETQDFKDEGKRLDRKYTGSR